MQSTSSMRGKGPANSAEARDRPIHPAVVTRAEALAAGYGIRIRRDGAGFAGTVAEMPSVFGHGPSEEAAVGTTRDLLKWAIAYLIEDGHTPPGPA